MGGQELLSSEEYLQLIREMLVSESAAVLNGLYHEDAETRRLAHATLALANWDEYEFAAELVMRDAESETA